MSLSYIDGYEAGHEAGIYKTLNIRPEELVEMHEMATTNRACHVLATESHSAKAPVTKHTRSSRLTGNCAVHGFDSNQLRKNSPVSRMRFAASSANISRIRFAGCPTHRGVRCVGVCFLTADS